MKNINVNGNLILETQDIYGDEVGDIEVSATGDLILNGMNVLINGKEVKGYNILEYEPEMDAGKIVNDFNDGIITFIVRFSESSNTYVLYKLNRITDNYIIFDNNYFNRATGNVQYQLVNIKRSDGTASYTSDNYPVAGGGTTLYNHNLVINYPATEVHPDTSGECRLSFKSSSSSPISDLTTVYQYLKGGFSFYFIKEDYSVNFIYLYYNGVFYNDGIKCLYQENVGTALSLPIVTNFTFDADFVVVSDTVTPV